MLFLKRNVLLHLFFAFIVLFITSCTPIKTTCNGCSKSKKLSPRIIFIQPDGKQKIIVHVELACTMQEHEVGLMYRKKLDKNKGMLFVFSQPKIQSFWMKNTYIPLDMVHISHDKKLVGYIENAQPHDLSSQSIHKPSQYVLEVNAFFMRRYQITKRWKINFIDIPSCY